MNESEKQFSFTRAASSTSGRAKKQIPISSQTAKEYACFCSGQTPAFSDTLASMKTALRVVGLLLAATAVAMAETRTWTFEKSGKTMQGEVVRFAGDTVTIKRPDGQAFSVPIAYLTESNRVDLAAERVKQWKEVEVVKLEGVTSAGRYKRCTVQGREVNGEILIQFLPASVEAILNSRNQLAAQIADLSDRIENRDRAVQRADLVTPIGAGGDPAYVDAVMAQRKQVNLASLDVTDAKVNLAKLQAAYADYIDKTRAATTVKMITVKMKNIGFVYEGLPVWECFDPRKPQQ